MESIDGFEPARRRILEAALARAPFEGWTPVLIRRAAAEACVDRASAAAAFPGGVADLLRFWSLTLDEAMVAATAEPSFQSLRTREKVPTVIRSRLAALKPHKEAARRAAATLALPIFAPLGLKLAWSTADAVWRAMGDGSTDFNFYTKRATLMGVWTSTFARWLADDDDENVQAFLDRRIENVMQVEKLKSRIRDSGFDPEGMLGWLAKRRYPASR